MTALVQEIMSRINAAIDHENKMATDPTYKAAVMKALKERNAAREAALIARAKEDAKAAVGKPYAVRLDKTRTVRGVIVEAEFSRVQPTGKGMKAVWRVVIEAGLAKTHWPMFVDALPR